MRKYLLLLMYFVFVFTLNAQDFPLVSMSDIYDENPDINNCYEGKLKDSEKQKAMNYVNYIRSFHKLKSVAYASNYDKETAKSALITVANALLDHFPKSSYYCYTQDGYNGSSTSNLFIYASTTPSRMPTTETGIQEWIIDEGIEDVGHRRNLLNPFLKYTSFGRVDGYSKAQSSWFVTGMSIKVHQFPDYHNLSDWTPDFVAYPFEDYPSAYVNPNWYLSFTLIADKSSPWNNDNRLIDYSQASVKVTDPNNNQLSISNLKYDYQGYGVPNCIYWKVTGLQKEVRYTVTISNVKVGGTSRNYTYWFRITDNPPSAGLQPPTPLSPPDNATDIEIPVTLSWSNITDAQFYALQVATNSNFTNLVVDTKTLTTNSYTLTNLLPSTKYYWRVATIKNNQQSGWSAIYSFTTKNIVLTTPVPLSPLDGGTSVDLKPTFTWSKVAAADKYHLQLSLDPAFDGFSLVIDKSDITDTIYTSTTKLSAKTMYYWRVRAQKGSNFSDWSATKSFWTLDPSIVEQVPNNLFEQSIIIDDPMKATISLKNIDEIATVSLYNLFGERIQLKELTYNGIAINIPYDKIPSGVWILKIETKDIIQTLRLLIPK